MSTRRSVPIVFAAAAALMAAAGCGDEHYHPTTSSYIKPHLGRAPAQQDTSFTPLPMDNATVAGGGDPDPMTANQRNLEDAGPTDDKDALAGPTDGSDPLTADQRGDSVENHTALENGTFQLTTAHTHWIRGQIHDGSCTVYLNGAQIVKIAGGSSGVGEAKIDKDISLPFHKGTNTATFYFVPASPKGWTSLNILESEHDPPIAPLASFNTQTLPNPSLNGNAREQRQSFVFTAE